LRKTEPDLPIILATGYADIQAGTGPTLPRLAKPFTSADLAEAIRKVFPV
jgi:FixJ family two-component response regulator